MIIQTTRIPSRPALRIGLLSTPWLSWRISVTISLAFAVALAFTISLTTGDYHVDMGRVLHILFGGTSTHMEHLVVMKWRLPRAIVGTAVGCALGISGALVQSMTRNPLASPDILGITTGASAMAVTVIVLSGSQTTGLIGWLANAGVPVAAMLGGTLTAIVIWALAFRRRTDTFRLVLFGILITTLLSAYIDYLLVRAALHDAAAAQRWLVGSLSTADWASTIPISLVLLICTPVLGWVAFQLKATVLGTTIAAALGQRLSVVQFVVVALAISLAAIAVSTAGPIGFVAFVGPQVAVRLCRASTPPLIASGLCAALILLTADIASQTLLAADMPVGLLTAVIGGIFLIYLLIRTNRRTTT